MNDQMKRVIELATALVLSRYGDVDTEDGSFATVDADIIIQLDCAIAEAFELNSDDVNESDIPIIMEMLKSS
jgi:hypothetical protein